MTRNTEIARAVRYAILMGSLAAASAASVTAQAQVAPQAATDQEATTTLSTVIVTGSRIPQPNLEAISPVTAISAEEFKLSGVARVEDLLNRLPQVVADQGGNLSNGATGTATVDLRGLGAQRTLVLVNGRRLMPGDPFTASSADLNQIPSALVERVDVETGGASTDYGADAVAGVVNFIMNDHFQGIRVDANLDMYQHSQHNGNVETAVDARHFAEPAHDVRDGYGKDVTLLLGGNFDEGRGNVTVYAGYRNLGAVLQGNRDFSACSLSSGHDFGCAGSSTSFPGRFLGNDGGDYTIGPNRTLLPYTSANAFNFAPFNYYQRPDERYTGGAFAHYKLNDHAEAYAEVMLMDDHTLAQIAPSGLFLGGGNAADGGALINSANPLLSPAEHTAFCTDGKGGSVVNAAGFCDVFLGRRNVEGGARADDLTHTSYRMVVGMRGDIAPGWKYDVYGTDGTTRLSENYHNDVSKIKMGFALNAVLDPVATLPGGIANPTFGKLVCAANVAGANGAPGCVPWNIFTLGGVTPAQAAYLGTPGFQEGNTTERVASASVTGDLGNYGAKSPMAKDGLAINVGAEYRQEKLNLVNDQEFLTGDLSGQGGPIPNTTGQFHVWEGIVEARLPLIQDQPFTKLLTTEVGYRYSSYTEGFNTNTYKFGLEWAPITDVRFRGSYQQAVRAPNIQELFQPDRVALDGSTDPCAGVAGPPSAGCVASGIPAGFAGTVIANPAAQYNGLIGGNTKLLPEKSHTRSAGIVFTPSFVPDFSASIDYFDINITNVINGFGADFILGQCISTQAAVWCSKVHRAPGTFSLWLGPQGFIEDTNFNTGALETKGVDVAADYKLRLGPLGRLAFSFVGTYTNDLTTTPVIGGGSYNCAGFYGPICNGAASPTGAPTPKWRHAARGTWGTPVGVDLSLAWRHINEVRLDSTSANPLLNHGAPASAAPPTDVKLGSRDYLDLTASYTFAKTTFRVGVNNVTDKDPPVIGSSSLPPTVGSGNTFPQLYDSLGRFVFFNVTADF